MLFAIYVITVSQISQISIFNVWVVYMIVQITEQINSQLIIYISRLSFDDQQFDNNY